MQARRIYVAASNETYLGLYVQWTMFRSGYKQIWIFYTDFS